MHQRQGPQTSQAIDPNEKQRIASNPAQSVWVDASAGTGKTKILTDRVLRLLLSDETRPASPPERIVCITFTKAAASEMSLRITKTLSKWSIYEEDALSSALQNLIGFPPSSKQVKEARTLFARVIDVPGGLKIMTIHAFCQSILQKFPLEAGLSPNFTVLTQQEATETIQMARYRVLKRAQKDPNGDLGHAVRNLSLRSGEAQLMKFLESGLSEKQQIIALFNTIGSLDNIKPALLDACQFHKDTSEEKLTRDYALNTPIQDIKTLRDAYNAFGTAKEKDERETRLNTYLEKIQSDPSTMTQTDIREYSRAFLKKDGGVPAKLATKKVLDASQEVEPIINDEINRYKQFEDSIHKLHMIEDTYNFLCVSHAILDTYAQEKTLRNALDFDDLISKTHALLINSETAAQWVLFKLDQGIDHLLVDEAQDTNPEQWQVVEALSDEFFHGQSARDNIERTLFVVGDEKQSIYSFQKADPKIFRDMQAMFKDKISRASKQWRDVPLNLSFRSTDAVLTLVDLVFASQEMRTSLTAQGLPVEHTAFRQGQAGHVELWPIIYGEETQTLEPWPIPKEPTGHVSAADLMAKKIAGTIKHWIDTGRKLAATDQPIHAGDIMILLKKRSVFQKTLVRALKDHGIPVGGLDRLVLQDHIAVKDMLAILEFGLLPQDNLTLATILKSPLIGWDEDQLMTFVLDNQKATSLWVALADYAPNIHAYLLQIHDLTLKKRTFDVMSFLLNNPCPQETSGLRAFVKRLGEDALDPLQELLNTALDTEGEKGLSVQSFVHRLKNQETEIKREMEDGTGAVRIMTVHGSKGLQAPIVFLPDTMRIAQSRDNAQQSDSKLLWPRRSGLTYPFWAPRTMPDMLRTAKDRALARDDCEYQRLLYVALTRASDELYISGYLKSEKTKPLPDSWYCQIERAFDTALESGIRTPCTITKTDSACIIKNPQTTEIKGTHTQTEKENLPDLPSWATKKPRAEPTPFRPLQPSRPSGEVSALSPLSSTQQRRYKRGNIIHTLLEFLPDLPKEQWRKSAQHYLAQSGHGLSSAEQANITEEILKILNDPIFAPVFGKNSRAEVSISGLLGTSTIVNGQIDRLVITDTDIFIVDYKTNRPAAETIDDVPDQYKKQLESYRAVLTKIYPNHTIRTALLWTNIPKLMEISS